MLSADLIKAIPARKSPPVLVFRPMLSQNFPLSPPDARKALAIAPTRPPSSAVPSRNRNNVPFAMYSSLDIFLSILDSKSVSTESASSASGSASASSASGSGSGFSFAGSTPSPVSSFVSSSAFSSSLSLSNCHPDKVMSSGSLCPYRSTLSAAMTASKMGFALAAMAARL